MKKKDTSWEQSAGWYDTLLSGEDTYQRKVIEPNLMRMLQLDPKERLLDLACGQGYFTSLCAPKVKESVGADLSPTLIDLARKNVASAQFFVADAVSLSFAKDASFDVVVCVLGLQNMENARKVMSEVRRVLKSDGRFVFVLNHPVFRIPKQSSWGYDEAAGIQYRRVDSYLSSSKNRIDMHPGIKDSEHTWSFHRSLQDYMKMLSAAGLAITRLEEWISHKDSQPGPRAAAENTARKEIPLFLAIETRVHLGPKNPSDTIAS